MKIAPEILADMAYRVEVRPWPAGAMRPLWSVMIPTFNSAADLRRSLASVLAQDPGATRMQIEVVDDCSTKDDPERVVQELAGTRVAVHRQPRNVGHTRNFNTCLERSRGHLVHLLHADDWVEFGFYATMAQALEAEPEAGAAFCRHEIVSPDPSIQRLSPLERPQAGVVEGWLQTIAAELRLQPPSIVVRRAVYEQIGGFDTRMASCGEDWEMWVRIAACYPVVFVPDVLASYQDSVGSLTKRAVTTGQNVRDVRMATLISRRYLRGPARSANRRAMESWAGWALYWAYRLSESGDFRSASVQLREALRCSRSPRTLRLTGRISKYAISQAFGRMWARRHA